MLVVECLVSIFKPRLSQLKRKSLPRLKPRPAALPIHTRAALSSTVQQKPMNKTEMCGYRFPPLNNTQQTLCERRKTSVRLSYVPCRGLLCPLSGQPVAGPAGASSGGSEKFEGHQGFLPLRFSRSIVGRWAPVMSWQAGCWRFGQISNWLVSSCLLGSRMQRFCTEYSIFCSINEFNELMN